MIHQLRQLWESLPHRVTFVGLFVLWVLVFHFFGNSTLGYVNTPSLFGWLNALYNRRSAAESGDELCPFIPFLVALLFYLKRVELTAVRKEPWSPALGFILVGLVLHALGFLVQQTRLSAVGFVIGGFGIMGLVWGRNWMRLTCFPWLFLLAAIPIASYLDPVTFGLRLFSTKISVALCQNLFALKLVRQETLVSLAASGRSGGFHFEVAAACSGMRSVTAVLLISVLFAYLNFHTFWRRIVIVLGSIPLALAGNVLRLSTVFLVGDAFGEGPAKYVETKMGFVTWIAALVGLFLLGRWLREPSNSQPTPSPEASPPGRQAPTVPTPSWGPLLPGLALILIVVGVAGVAFLRNHQRLGNASVRIENVPLISDSGRIARTNSVHLPLEVRGFNARSVAITDLEFDYLPPDTSFGRTAYLAEDGRFSAVASVVLMGTDRTSIHRPEYCLSSQGWDIVRRRFQSIPVFHPPALPMEVQRFDTRISGQDSQGHLVQKAGVYVFWFATEGLLTARHSSRQWSMIKGLLLDNVLQRWAYISFFAECLPGEEDACYLRLSELISKTAPGIVVKPSASGWAAMPN